MGPRLLEPRPWSNQAIATTEETTMFEDQKTLSVTADDRVRAIRDRMNAAKLRVQIAMQFTMHAEVREQLRSVQSDLAVALAYIGK